MNFGFDGVGGGVSSGPLDRGLTTFFKYDKSIQSLPRVYYDNTTWEAIIKAQLDAGLPVFYTGANQTNTSDHAFIIDGYDNEGKFHINWGWNGRDDGYYSLDALNPPSGNYDFNYDNTIIINIKPNEGGVADYEMTLNSFTTSKTTVRQNEIFIVNYRFRNIGGMFPGGQAGVALVDNNGNIVEIVGTRDAGGLGAGLLGTLRELNCTVPATVPPGQYQLRIVIKPKDSGDWKIATLSLPDIPNSIDFTVADPNSPTPAVPPAATVSISSDPVASSGNFTVMPNPVVMTSSSGTAAFFWQGARLASGTVLPVYNASGDIINGIEIKDPASASTSKRRIASWNLRDLDGRPAPKGRYTVRGVLTTSDGSKERVELSFDVR
jgi:hypothetical protein